MKTISVFQKIADIFNDEFCGQIVDEDDLFAFFDEEDNTLKIKILTKGVAIDKKFNVEQKDFVNPDQTISSTEKYQIATAFCDAVDHLKDFIQTLDEDDQDNNQFYSQFIDYFNNIEEIVTAMREYGIFSKAGLFDRDNLENLIRTNSSETRQ